MRHLKPLVVSGLLLCALGLWGCNQQKTGAISDKIRELETRYSKLEEDYRTLYTTSEESKKRVNAVEEQRTTLETEKADLAKKVETATTERDTLRKQIAQRTTERDAAQTHLLQFSRDLQALAGRVEAAAQPNSPNQNQSIIPASRRNE